MNVLRGVQALAVCAVGFCGLPAQAILGERTSLAISSPSTLSPGAVRRVQAVTLPSQTPYLVSEAELETGTLLREFSLPNGVVFAVSWTGPVLPDLKEALGRHFVTFAGEVERMRAQGQRGGPVSFERNNMVLSSTGRMGAFSGHAVLPHLVPVGVDIHELLK
jgi:hypothetical protein